MYGVGMGGGKIAIEQGGQTAYNAIFDRLTKRGGETIHIDTQQAGGARLDAQTGVDTPAAQNGVEGVETASTAVDVDPATHTPEQQAVIEAYQADTDETLKEVFQGYLDNPNQGFSRHNISSVSQRQAQDAERLLGGTYEGYRNAINSNGIQHILGEHGPSGTVDHTLGDLNDIARMGYVLDNYDNVEVVTYESGDADYSREFRDKDDRPAPMLKFSKRVDGTYYVVEAIPESKHKKFWVVSAYMEKADGGTQAPNVSDPGNTPNASLASSPSASATSIPKPPKMSSPMVGTAWRTAWRIGFSSS